VGDQTDKKKSRFTVLILAIGLTTTLQAQDQPEPAVAQACKRVENVPIPKPTLTVQNCSAPRLYYGTTGKPDYAAALQCALADWPNKAYEDDFTTGSAGTLIMIYANGDGVPRNLEIALHAACIRARDNDDYDKLILDLLKLKTDPSEPKFDFCEYKDLILDRNSNDCDDIALELQAKHRDDALAKLMTRWTPQQRAAYEGMRKSQDAYVTAQNQIGNACLHGWGSTYAQPRMDNNLNDKLVEELTGFEQGQLPSSTRQDYLIADKTLNLDYAKVMGNLRQALKSPIDPSCPVFTEPDDLQDSERAWIIYRDRWVVFAKTRWPQISADSWLTLLTQKRTEAINAIEIQ
jgi:uncharacterized protein YecT (DUF1311 family)